MFEVIAHYHGPRDSHLLPAAELEAQEDKDIEYTKVVPGQRIYVGTEENAVNSIWMFLSTEVQN